MNKALKALNTLKNDYAEGNILLKKEYTKCFSTIKKQLKLNNILIRKQVNVSHLIWALKNDKNSYKYFTSLYGKSANKAFSKKEYIFLKKNLPVTKSKKDKYIELFSSPSEKRFKEIISRYPIDVKLDYECREFIARFKDFKNIIGVGMDAKEAIIEACGNLAAFLEYIKEQESNIYSVIKKRER